MTNYEEIEEIAISIDPVDDYYFEGLGRQNMAFHHALGELVDNAVAASDPPFRIDIHLEQKNETVINVTIADRGSGMGLLVLKDRALKLGAKPNSGNRLNEHGFGLKNGLCTITGGNKSHFSIRTRDAEILKQGKFCQYDGPFTRHGIIRLPSTGWPTQFGPEDTGTVISVDTTLGFLQTMQEGFGTKATNLATLAGYLIEHLGVMYKGFLSERIPGQGKFKGQIMVHQGGDVREVVEVPIPMNDIKVNTMTFDVDGVNYDAMYKSGIWDEELAKSQGASLYYQGNIRTQGIDIRIGGRTIATKQFSEIWDLARHPSYNSFLGELTIPEKVPLSALRTVNNKLSYDMEDPTWKSLFMDLQANHPPSSSGQNLSEAEMRDKLQKNILALNPKDTVQREYPVWSSAVSIDVYREQFGTGDIEVYELKTVNIQPIHIYQLKMYWDGLVLAGKNPTKGVLVGANYNDSHQSMVTQINQWNDANGVNYNFELKRREELDL